MRRRGAETWSARMKRILGFLILLHSDCEELGGVWVREESRMYMNYWGAGGRGPTILEFEVDRLLPVVVIRYNYSPRKTRTIIGLRVLIWDCCGEWTDRIDLFYILFFSVL